MSQAQNFVRQFQMDLNESVAKPGSDGKKKVHKRIATVAIPFPSLDEFGIPLELLKQAVYDEDNAKENQKKGEPAFDNGVPVYENPVFDWLQTAVVDKVKAYSRNRYKKGELKPGLSLAYNFDELTAESARTGEALKLRREAKDSFTQYLAKLGKKQETCVTFGDLFFNSNRALGSAGEKYLAALDKWVNQWVETLTTEQTSRFAPKLTELADSLKAAQAKDDLDDDLADVEEAKAA